MKTTTNRSGHSSSGGNGLVVEHFNGGNQMSDQLAQKVETGMWAKVRGSQPGQKNFEEVFHFVASDQVNLVQNRVPIDCPLGQVLSGAKAGDKAQLETKSGKTRLVVLEVGRG